MISVKVRDRAISASALSPITSGSVGLPVKFAFSAEWDELTKTVIFRGSGTARDVMLTSDECAVPAEVLTQSDGPLEIGVRGTKIEHDETSGEDVAIVVIPTIWCTVDRIHDGAEPSEVDPSDPEPSWADQVQQAAATALAKAQAVEDAAGRGEFDGHGMAIIDTLPSTNDLPENPEIGDAYAVGTTAPYDIYTYGASGVWTNLGPWYGRDGATIWTTTAPPTSPNYTFTKSSLHGPEGFTPKVGDVILYSFYRYQITEVSANTVLAGNRESLRGDLGTQWYSGTGITGTPQSGTVFSDSGVTYARVLDKYLNVETGNVYNCVLAGYASTAKWVYLSNILGPKGDKGDKGNKGDTGATGPGVPAGGTDGDVLVKNGATDFAAKWARPYSRANLLDNWYFVYGKIIDTDNPYSSNGTFPINQRGQRGYSNSGKVYDRWTTEQNPNVNINQNDLWFRSNSVNNSQFYQSIDSNKLVDGATYTISVLVNNIVSYDSGTTPMFTMKVGCKDSPYSTFGSISFNSNGLITKTFSFNRGDYTGDYKFIIASAGTLSQAVWIKAVKLELGDTQTLAHQENGVWVLNEMPNYQQELAKCQRYLIAFKTSSNTKSLLALGFAESASRYRAVLPTPVTMKHSTNRPVELTGTVTAGSLTASSINSYWEENPGSVTLFVNVAGATVGNVAPIMLENGSTLIISAE